MNKILLALTITGALLSTFALYQISTPTKPDPTPDFDAAWDLWKKTYGRTYGSEEEEKYRKVVFMHNLVKVKTENSDPENTFTLKLNKFGDIGPIEFKKLFMGLKLSQNQESREPDSVFDSNGENLPESVDWRTKGAVTPVKDQGSCGSCWAFSTTGSLEGSWAIKSGKLQSMSEQQLVDCDRKSDEGCNGGEMGDAWVYLKKAGIETEKEYPYKAKDRKCQYKSSAVISGLKISGYTQVKKKSEDALKAAVAKTTVAISIDGDGIQFYDKGIFNSKKCGHVLNHGVLAVGYGVSPKGEKYWIVKNSWASDWGEKGYIRVVRKDGSGKIAMCGINLDSSFPILG